MKTYRAISIAIIAVSLLGAAAQATVAHGYSNILAIDTVSAVEIPDSPSPVTGIVAIFPTPFNPQTTIKFELAQSGDVELAIFDVRGQLVRVLDKGSRGTGHYQVTWSGRDKNDRLMPAGAYFCQLVTATSTQTKRLTLVK